MSPGGGAQAAAPKAGQHHGCRCFFWPHVNAIIFLWVFCNEYYSVYQFTNW